MDPWQGHRKPPGQSSGRLGFALPWGQVAGLGAAVVGTGTLVAYGVGRWGSFLPADREE